MQQLVALSEWATTVLVRHTFGLGDEVAGVKLKSEFSRKLTVAAPGMVAKPVITSYR